MATKNKHNEADTEVKIQTAIGKVENFIMENGKHLLIGLSVAALIVAGLVGYKYLLAAPRADKAADMMFVAQQHFAVDSFALALHGDGTNQGFLDVIAKYGSTPQGNLAKHYAGICYLKQGDFQQALDHLSQYKAKGDVPGVVITAQNYGLQGDAQVEMGNLKQAAVLYDKAAAQDNLLTTPYFLKKAALAYEQLGEKTQALERYRTISIDFAASMESRDIQKDIARIEQL